MYVLADKFAQPNFHIKWGKPILPAREHKVERFENTIMESSKHNCRASPLLLAETFKSLYSEDNEEDGARIVLVGIYPTSTLKLSSNLPLPTRFPYQHPGFPPAQHDLLSRVFLQLVPQMVGFVSGKLPLIIFDLDEMEEVKTKNSSKEKRPHQLDVSRSLEQLSPDQRPDVTFVAKPSDILVPPGSRISVPNPMDYLLHLAHVVDPDTHYDLLSKRSLALSGLPSPPSHVIDSKIPPSQVHDQTSVAAEIDRMLQSIQSHPIPFVVKLPQALAGRGTFRIRTETERAFTIELLSLEVARMISVLNSENAHLSPVSFVLQEMIPGEAVALSLFITKAGRAHFIGCAKQIEDEIRGWSGGSISYPDQDELQEHYDAISQKISQYMHAKGYYGPIGTDIMTGVNGEQYIIDMNVRICGTMPLGFLRSVLVGLGYNNAVLFFPFLIPVSRDEFEEIFGIEIQEKKVVIVAWSHGRAGKTSAAMIVLAEVSLAALEDLIKRVNAYKARKS
jgi:hypothetical protein